MLSYNIRMKQACWLAIGIVGLLAAPAAAQPAACFDRVRTLPDETFAADHITVAIEGRRPGCRGARVAAVGDRDALGPPFDRAVNIVVALRDLPFGLPCGEPSEVPFTLVAHLPRLAPNNPHDGPHSVGLFLRHEDAAGNLSSLQTCEELGVFVEPGSRSSATFHEGRFRVDVTWKVESRQGLGWVVPAAQEPPADAALFWFFAPENWELLVKVLDGCGVNGHYWVLGAAATNVEFELQIHDTVGNVGWSRRNVPGTLAPAFADVTAFPCG